MGISENGDLSGGNLKIFHTEKRDFEMDCVRRAPQPRNTQLGCYAPPLRKSLGKGLGKGLSSRRALLGDHLPAHNVLNGHFLGVLSTLGKNHY